VKVPVDKREINYEC